MNLPEKLQNLSDSQKAQIKQLIARERQNALEDVGAIGADYSDSQDTEYRDAVEGYIISQRRTLQAQADKGEQG